MQGAIDNVISKLSAQGVHVERKKLVDLYLEKMQDPHCDQLVAEMAAAGIEKAVLLLPDFTFALRDSALTIAEMFERHRAILARRLDTFLSSTSDSTPPCDTSTPATSRWLARARLTARRVTARRSAARIRRRVVPIPCAL